MNRETELLKGIVSRNPGIVEAARVKASDPKLVYAGMKDRDTAFRLALSSTIAQSVPSVSFSTFDRVDWSQVL